MVRFQIAFLCTLLCSFTLTAQDRSLKKVRHLDQLLGESKFDSLLRFERECALEFHKLINQYCKDNRRKVLVWNDSLWLAARNHTDYLIYNTVFDHSQDSKRPLYSGVSPTERCKFVFDKSNVDYACGENIALNYIGASNAVDAANDNCIVFSRVTPVAGSIAPDNLLPTSAISGVQTLGAYYYCDNDNNGSVNIGDTYTLISTFTATINMLHFYEKFT
jgi:hypothetical protein